MFYIKFLFYFLIASTVFSQTVNIPDPVFKNRLINHSPTIDTNSDGEIQISEAILFSETINVSGVSGATTGIEDLTGLESFTNIEGFEASFNFFENADFSGNIQIRDIVINDTPLAQIELSSNTLLRGLSISDSQLTNLDVTNNSELLLLQANFSNLGTLDLANNPSLQFLYVQQNQISSINLNNNTNLVALNISDNPLKTLNINNNLLLVFLNLRNLQLETLNVSNNVDLEQLDIKNNQELSYINLKNGTNEDLDISGGSSTSNFEDLPALVDVCIDDINSNLANFIQSQTSQAVSFSETCILSITESIDESFIKLYPVPAQEIVYLEASIPIISIKVYDILGQLVWAKASHKGISHINISHLTSGNYIFSLTNGDYITLNRLVCKK
tara:strand:+ start:26381 stop:27544 length:1164 start_codon:yes stop_codon:yes gene_type:complete